MQIERIEDLKQPPQVGKTYLVPVVRYWWAGVLDEWPVLPSQHRDPLLNFDVDHWHVDARFTTLAQDKLAAKKVQQMGHPSISKLHGEELFCESARSVALTYAGRPMPDTAQWRPRKCRRVYAKAYIRCPRTEGLLHAKFGPSPAAIVRGGVLRCPHQGAILDHIPLNEDGTITCPMHGMRVLPASKLARAEVGADGVASAVERAI